ncbi:MAG: hypothetical protein WAO28_03755 [Candidatus Microsaccharimonas sp.]
MSTLPDITQSAENEPAVRRDTEEFLDGFFDRTLEQIAEDHFDLHAANALLANDATPDLYRRKAQIMRTDILARVLPSKAVSKALKGEYAAELHGGIDALEVEADALVKSAATVDKGMLIHQALFDLRYNLHAGFYIENVPELVGLQHQDDFSSVMGDRVGSIAVGVSQRMQNLALADWHGGDGELPETGK